MDKLEFTNVLIDYLENDLKCDFQMEPIKITKDNGIVNNGIAFYKSDNPGQRMIIYIDDVFEDYISFERSLSDIGKELFNMVNQVETPTNMLDFWKETMSDFNKAKEFLFIKLSTPEYADKLDVPYTDEGEFIATYHVGKFDSENSSSIRINDSILKSWGKDIDEIREAALDNIKKDNILCSMDHLILSNAFSFNGNINNYLVNDEKIELNGSYVLFNNNPDTFGASALLDVDTLEKVYNKTKSDFVIAPICKHEAIIIPTLFKEEKEFERIGKEVIESSVPPEEVLSDKVYRYDSLNKKIVTNKDYELNYYSNLADELISIAETIDPYETKDSKVDNEKEFIQDNLCKGNIDSFIDFIKTSTEDLQPNEIAKLYGEDMPERLDRVLKHLDNIKAGKEQENVKPKSI